MRYRALFIVVFLYFTAAMASVADEGQRVQVADPYLELQTGPGSGYPVFYVVERGEWIEILKRKTDWFKVRTSKGREGWVKRSQMEQTLTPGGEKIQIKDAAVEDFLRRRWELGMSSGDFNGATILSIYGGYAFTRNLSTELSFSHVLGKYSSSILANIDLVAQPFPEWRVSPFFALGTGVIRTKPRTTLVQTEDRTDKAAHVGAGLRVYMARRFILRLSYRSYVIFTSRDDNEEIDEWQVGFAAFF